jgi:CO/xanthine dehydrogenase Mo-binding subunit
MKFGIGQPMRRHEDLRLITGRGRYTDDVIAVLAQFRTRRPSHIREMPRCRAVLSGIRMLAGGDQTAWLRWSDSNSEMSL